jgi:hypothetical protein
MRVPDGVKPCKVCGGQHDRALRLRELARAKIGPRSAKAGLKYRDLSGEDTRESVERVRLNRWANVFVNPVPAAYCPEELSAKIGGMVGDLRAMTLAMLGLTDRDFNDLELGEEAANWDGTRWATRIARTARGDIGHYSTFEDVARTAAWVEEQLASVEDALPDEDEDEQELDELMMEMLAEESSYVSHDRGSREVGLMQIDKPALSVPVRPDRHARGKRSAEEGDVLRDATRLLTDGRIFAGRRRKVGGSVLVDASGSMHWDTEALIEVVSSAPAATVGVYSGQGGRGMLRVVAKRGRRVPDELVRTPMRGNEVDIPALEWLGKQPGPRVWLSDGQVCGSGMDTSFLLGMALKLCRMHDIRRVNDASQIVPALHRRAGVFGGYGEDE